MSAIILSSILSLFPTLRFQIRQITLTEYPQLLIMLDVPLGQPSVILLLFSYTPLEFYFLSNLSLRVLIISKIF